MAKRLFNVRAYSDTAAKWAANTRVYPPNSLLIETDTGAIKRGDGVNTYADLVLIGAGTGTGTAWEDIADKPASFPPVAHDHAVADISDWPATFEPSAHDHTIAQVNSLQTALDGKSAEGHSHAWTSITGKPSTFAPSTHDHAVADISDWPASFPPASHDHAVVADATSGLVAAATIQALAEALSARILALETAAE